MAVKRVLPKAVHQIKITLEGFEPPIWGRVQVLSDCTLAQLHRVVQAVIGWEDCRGADYAEANGALRQGHSPPGSAQP